MLDRLLPHRPPQVLERPGWGGGGRRCNGIAGVGMGEHLHYHAGGGGGQLCDQFGYCLRDGYYGAGFFVFGRAPLPAPVFSTKLLVVTNPSFTSR